MWSLAEVFGCPCSRARPSADLQLQRPSIGKAEDPAEARTMVTPLGLKRGAEGANTVVLSQNELQVHQDKDQLSCRNKRGEAGLMQA